MSSPPRGPPVAAVAPSPHWLAAAIARAAAGSVASTWSCNRGACCTVCQPNAAARRRRDAYLRFWYQVFTWVSDRFRASATSLRSATDKYFWQRNFRSKYASCACVKAVLLRRGLRPFVPTLPSPPSPTPPLLPTSALSSGTSGWCSYAASSSSSESSVTSERGLMSLWGPPLSDVISQLCLDCVQTESIACR